MSTNLRGLCWAVFNFNFIKPTINPTKTISLLTQPKLNKPEPRQKDSIVTYCIMLSQNNSNVSTNLNF